MVKTKYSQKTEEDLTQITYRFITFRKFYNGNNIKMILCVSTLAIYEGIVKYFFVLGIISHQAA